MINLFKHTKKNNSKRQSINGKEFDTYKVGTVANSCSTMHKIQEKEFTLDDFSTDHLDDVSLDTFNYIIAQLEYDRKLYLKTKVKPMKDESKRAELMKKYWWQMIQLLPSSYNQTRNVMMNYEVLANIYKSRKNHKLDEWKVHETPEENKFRNKDFASGKWGFCDWIESLPYSELIIGAANANVNIPNSMSPGKLDIRWAEDIFKNHGIKLTEEQIDAINSICTTNNSKN